MTSTILGPNATLPAPAQASANFCQSRPETGILWRQPDAQAYEARKGLVFLPEPEPADFTERPQMALPPEAQAIVAANPTLGRSWQYFWSRRLEQAARADLSPCLTPFPGNTIQAPGKVAGSGQYRGSLFFEQYLNLPSLIWQSPVHELEDSRSNWIWRMVAPEAGEFVSKGTPSAPEAVTLALAGTHMDVPELLARTRQFWRQDSPGLSGAYTEQAQALCRLILAQTANRLDERAWAVFLFELEAFASFISMARLGEPVAAGQFAGTWLEVALVGPEECRLSEFCQTRRLSDEIANLSAGAFAPVVLNEDKIVTDGNHRLVAIWLWNILADCLDCDWQDESSTLSERLSALTATTDSPLAAQEAHHHLQLLLRDPDQCAQLATLRPNIEKHGRLVQMPVVFLPEHLAAPVVKSLYDGPGTCVRVHPDIYSTIARKPNCLLPERASYHFTDTVKLPWFDVFAATS